MKLIGIKTAGLVAYLLLLNLVLTSPVFSGGVAGVFVRVFCFYSGLVVVSQLLATGYRLLQWLFKVSDLATSELVLDIETEATGT